MVGDLYCETLRTLSTNWNLKFQRGEAEGPYPRVEMAWLLSPTTFVLCLDKSLTPSRVLPSGGWGRRRETAGRGAPGEVKAPGSQESRGLEGAPEPASAGDGPPRSSGS